MYNPLYLIVECKYVTTTMVQYGLHWSLGSCNLTLDDYNWPLTSVTKLCCFPSDIQMLRCKAQGSMAEMAWKQSSIEIAGHKFCDDFIGYTILLKINISGKSMIFK